VKERTHVNVRVSVFVLLQQLVNNLSSIHVLLQLLRQFFINVVEAVITQYICIYLGFTSSRHEYYSFFLNIYFNLLQLHEYFPKIT
jgi:hypothetical protein